MKKFLMILVLAATPIFAVAETVNVSVNGLVCSFCAIALEATLADIGAQDVQVSLEDAGLSFNTPDGLVLSDEQIAKAIEDAGYDIGEIERNAGEAK